MSYFPEQLATGVKPLTKDDLKTVQFDPIFDEGVQVWGLHFGGIVSSMPSHVSPPKIICEHQNKVRFRLCRRCGFLQRRSRKSEDKRCARRRYWHDNRLPCAGVKRKRWMHDGVLGRALQLLSGR